MARRAWRWSRRILLGLVAFIVVSVGVVLAILHTDWGREATRKQIEARLDDALVGGGSIGALEGSVLGRLVLRDVVLNGPDGKPAITIDKLTLGVPLLPLLSKEIRVTDLHAEGVDVDLRRGPDGALQISRMMKPGPKSQFAVQIPELVVEDAHVRLEGAGDAEDTNIDGIEIAGDVHMPAGEPMRANLLVTGRWRERDVPIWVDASVENDVEALRVPWLLASVGDAHVTAAGVHVVKPQPASLAHPRPVRPAVSGVIAVDATDDALARLAPKLDVPVDHVALSVIAYPDGRTPWTHLTVAGTVDAQPVFAELAADLEARRGRGIVATGMLDLAKLSNGKLEGHGTSLISFAGRAGEPGELPVGSAMIHVAGDIAGLDNARATVAVTSNGERVATAVSAVAPGSSAQIGARVTKQGERYVLQSSRVIARVRDPARLTGGAAPVRGALSVDARASGVLSPDPDLAVSGRLVGSRLRVQDVRVGSLKLAIDARGLPERPIGRAALEARRVQRGDLYLRELDVTAANREDGKIAVAMRSRPRTSPWLVEADALVTPGETVVIDLERHHVRAGSGADWRGTSGEIVIGPRRIDVRDVASASEIGRLAIAGHYHRAGRETGDLRARVDLEAFGLENISKLYRGSLQARADVTRTNGRFAGVVDAKATGVALDPNVLTFDAEARIEARADQLVVDARAASPRLGAVDLDLDIDAPDDITNVVAWKKLHREHIRSARLQLADVEIGRLADVAKLDGEWGGELDGDIRLSPTATGGVVRLREVFGPPLRNLGPVSASFAVTQTGPDELRPTIVATIDDRRAGGTTIAKPLATIEGEATLAMADHLFDPAAWRQLGRAAFQGGAVRVDDIVIEPPLLERVQLTTNLRGRASLLAELAPGLKSANLAIDVRKLRGDPIAVPTTLAATAHIDRAGATARLAFATAGPDPTPLVEIEASVPVSLAKVLDNPQAVRSAPLAVTATFPGVPARRLLATFGRTQMVGGTVTGTVEVRGTVAEPTVRARIAGTKLAVPPGPGNRPIKVVDRVALDATWDGNSGKLALDATQQGGMLQVLAQGAPDRLETATVSLTAKQFDLLPLLAFAPGPAGGAAGRLDAELEVKGLDLRRAKVSGEAHLSEGRLPIAPIVGTLRAADIDLVVGDTARVAVSGRLGGGTVKANGTFELEGAVPTRGSAKLALRDVSPIGAVEPEIDADVTAQLARRRGAWVTDIVVENAVIEVPEDRGEPLDPVGKPDDMAFVGEAQRREKKAIGEETRPTAPTLIANIVIEPTYIESAEVRGYVHGSLRVERDAEALAVVGKIEAERGNIDLFGRRYQLDRAVVRFDGSTDPLLDVVITHDFPEVSTRTQVRGRLSDPELIMTSDPGTYSQGQLLGFLLGGEPQGGSEAGSPRAEAIGAGASLIANRIGGYVKEALPLDLDVLRYESATASSGAAITAGTWLTRSLFIAYRRRIEAQPDENTGEGEAEYWLTRRLVVEGVIGDRGYNHVDLLWRRRY